MKYFRLIFLCVIPFILSSCENNEITEDKSLLKKAEIIFDKSYSILDEMFPNVKVNDYEDIYLIGTKSIVKTDKDGDIKWRVQRYYTRDLAVTKDGGCVISFANEDGVFHLEKINSAGEIQWKKTGESYKLSKIIVGDNDEIYGIGDIEKPYGYNKPKFFKYSQEGDLLFSKLLIDNDDKVSYYTRCMVKLKNSRIVIGTSNWTSNDEKNPDYNIIEFDVDVNSIYERNYGGYKEDSLTDITETPDGGLVLVGFTGSKDGDIKSWRDELSLEGANGWIVKLDHDRNIEWEKIMGGIGHTYFAQAIYNNGKILVAFETYDTDTDFKSPEEVKSGYIVFDNLGKILDIKYIETGLVWIGTMDIVSCAFAPNANLIISSNVYDDYYNTTSTRIIKIK